MRGPKPLPTAIKIARGNPSKRRLKRDLHVGLRAATLKPPVELAGDTRALTEWRRLTRALRDAGVLADVDRGALVAVCQQWSLYLEASARAREALLDVARSGYRLPSPYVGISNKALGNCLKLWAELGCTPSARTRVESHALPASFDPIEAALNAGDDFPAAFPALPEDDDRTDEAQAKNDHESLRATEPS